MVAIFLEPDPFGGNVDTVASDDLDPSSNFRSGGRMDYSHVRRPLRGIQIKNNTYATIQVWTADNRRVGLYDSGGMAGLAGTEDSEVDQGLKSGWRMQSMAANFLVQRITRRQSEKLHLIETFGDQDFGFFYGQKPIQMDFQGTLMNTEDFNWRSEWWANYQEVLRGTKLVERGARIYLTYDTYTLEGYLLNSSTTEMADTPYHAMFQFSMWVTRWEDSSSIGNGRFPHYDQKIPGQLNDLDHTPESPLLATRRLNSIAFHVRSAIDAVRWGITTIGGGLTGNAQSLIDTVKSFAFGSTQNIPMVVGPDPTTGFPTPMSPAVGIHELVASGTHFAPGSSPDGVIAAANFGQILIKGGGTAPVGRVNMNRIRGSFRLNYDEYPEGAVSTSLEQMGMGVFLRDPIAEKLQKQKDLASATLKTFGNFAKYGINLYAIPVDFIYGQVQGFQSMALAAEANILRTNDEIEAQGGVSFTEGATDADPLGLLGLPDTSVLEEEQEDRAAAAAAEDDLTGPFPPDPTFAGN
jgi:hypothetical protein